MPRGTALVPSRYKDDPTSLDSTKCRPNFHPFSLISQFVCVAILYVAEAIQNRGLDDLFYTIACDTTPPALKYSMMTS